MQLDKRGGSRDTHSQASMKLPLEMHSPLAIITIVSRKQSMEQWWSSWKELALVANGWRSGSRPYCWGFIASTSIRVRQVALACPFSFILIGRSLCGHAICFLACQTKFQGFSEILVVLSHYGMKRKNSWALSTYSPEMCQVKHPKPKYTIHVQSSLGETLEYHKANPIYVGTMCTTR